MRTISLILMSAVLLAAQTKTPEVRQPGHAGTASPAVIPDSAKEVEPYTYRYTDPQGRTWMYRQTPFGVTKWDERDTPKRAVHNSQAIRVTDLGDRVRFSRESPFGDQVWIRQKSELTDDDNAIINRAQQTLPGKLNQPVDGRSRIADKVEEKR